MALFEKPVVNLQIRVSISLALVGLIFFVFGIRLWYLQVVQGEYFRSRSENNLLRTVFVPPPRGIIFDRWGRPLVRNRPSFNVDFVAEDCPNPKETLQRLADLLHEDPAALRNRLEFQKSRHRFEPKLILKDVSREVVARIVARQHDLPGVVINVIPAREYSFGQMGAHVIGYLREVTREQLDDPEYTGYRLGDIVGQYGIESRWERYLQGKRGVQVVIVNANGIRIAENSYEAEVAGKNLTLSLDLDVQAAADKALEGKRGGIVAIDPGSGEILAMTSGPAFDPNLFAGEMTADMWREMVGGKERRMNNRVVQGSYPPGSTFKPFMAVAALAEGVISTEERIGCPGYLHFANRNYHCWKKTGHGGMNLREAIARSCDVYFYTVGQRLGIDRIHEYATRFGMGIPSGISLVQEAPGLIPSTAWKRKFFKDPGMQKWYPGETLSVAIGQGAVIVTPLQLANATAALVNGGNLYTPHLVKKIESHDGQFRDEDFKPQLRRKTEIPSRYTKLVQEAMVAVVHDQGGTGGAAKLDERFGIKVGGKTGTAQVVSLGAEGRDEHLKDHAWFVGFAPAEKPEIVVAVLVENGGHGGSAAAPLCRQVMEAYFDAKQKRQIEAGELPAPLPSPGPIEKVNVRR